MVVGIAKQEAKLMIKDEIKFMYIDMYRIFIIVILTSLCYISYFFMVQPTSADISVGFVLPKGSSYISSSIALERLKPYDFYSSRINARDIFSVPLKPVQTRKQPSTIQFPDNYKVVGILLGVDPTVIIEDVNLHQAYFIDREHSQGGVALQRTEVNKVFLNYQGQTIEVPLKGSLINVSQK